MTIYATVLCQLIVAGGGANYAIIRGRANDNN